MRVPHPGCHSEQPDCSGESSRSEWHLFASRYRQRGQHLHWKTENTVFFDKILTKIFGTANERTIKRLMPVVAEINDLEPGIQQLTDENLGAKTVEFRGRIADRVEERLKGIENNLVAQTLAIGNATGNT